jgi:hypothetical protein
MVSCLRSIFGGQRKAREFAVVCVALSGATILTSPASACMVFMEPEQRIALAYRKPYIESVALVRVTQATYSRPQYKSTHPWEASASVVRSLHGSIEGEVKFRGGGGTSACQMPYELPKAGDEWIVYSWPDRTTFEAYPASVAYEADPNIRR